MKAASPGFIAQTLEKCCFRKPLLEARTKVGAPAPEAAPAADHSRRRENMVGVNMVLAEFV